MPTLAWHALLVVASGALMALLIVRTSQPPEASKDASSSAQYTIDALTLSMLLALLLLGVLTAPVLTWLKANVGTIKAGTFELAFNAAASGDLFSEIVEEEEGAPKNPREAAERLREKLKRVRNLLPEAAEIENDFRLVSKLCGDGALPPEQAALANSLLTSSADFWPAGQELWAHRAQKLIREIVQRAWEQEVIDQLREHSLIVRFVESLSGTGHWPDFVVSGVNLNPPWIRVAARTATLQESNLLLSTQNRLRKLNSPPEWHTWIITPASSHSEIELVDSVNVIKLDELDEAVEDLP